MSTRSTTPGVVAAARPRQPLFKAVQLSPASVADWLDCPGDLVAGTPFQGACWLRARYASLAAEPGIELMPVAVRAAADGAPAAVLPLMRRRRAGVAILEFVDLGLTDYNAPLLGPAAPQNRAGAAALMRAVRDALPPVDYVRLSRMPASIEGRVNPLTLLAGTEPSPVAGNRLELGDDYLAWRRATLDRQVRKELERAWRVFSRHPGAAFVRARDLDTARHLYADLTALQRTRAEAAGFAVYRLDEPASEQTYRFALEQGLADGSVVLTALQANGETVAAVFGIADGTTYCMVRIADARGEWRTCTPGRLIMERTIEHLHSEGYRRVDLGAGEHWHKQRFKAVPVPLVDLRQVLTPAGWAFRSYERAKVFVKARAERWQRSRTAGGSRPTRRGQVGEN